jgi:hypothetical protein
MRKRTAPTRSSIVSALALAFMVLLARGVAPAERTVVFGTDDEWRAIVVDERITVQPGRRGYLDLTLEAFRHEVEETTELLLHFDATPLGDAAGRYVVSGGAQELTRTAQRTGSGALLVDGPEDRLVLVPRPESAFRPGNEWGSFSIEFWYYPAVLSDGAMILNWTAREGPELDHRVQELSIETERGTTVARFANFFIRPDGTGAAVTLRGPRHLIPRRWAHHLIRFDETTGLIEYLVDGVVADLTHVSSTGRQDGSVFYPRIARYAGDGLVLAEGLVGALDELRIERRFVDEPALQAFPDQGGEIITDYLDLGSSGARLTRIDASYDAPGFSDVFLFYRISEVHGIEPGADDWIPVEPGAAITDARGRFLQVRAELLPDTRDGIAPSLSEISVSFQPNPPPLPPTPLRAVPHDGAVTIDWGDVHDPGIEGYLVYYGDQSGRYFGTQSDLGPSPIDVGNATSVTISGLENGTLYFFAVQAYGSSYPGPHESGHAELSRELAARPARVYR